MGREAFGLLLKRTNILKLSDLFSSSSFIEILGRSLMLTSEKLTNNKINLSQGNFFFSTAACKEPAYAELCRDIL